MIAQDETRALAEKADREEADGVFISCTNLATADIIEPLERELGKPAVTSNQATFWMALREMGIDAFVPGCGRLLAEPLP
jgi:arylmalonate decarboxylase